MEVAILKLLNWIGRAFLSLLNMSISAGWLILAVIVLRLLLKKAPKQLTCILWATVAIRLLCPFSIESSFSLIPSAETVPVQNIYSSDRSVADNPYYHQLQSGFPQPDRATVPVMTESKSGPAFRDNIALLAAVWIVGMLFIFLYAIVNFKRIRATVKEAVPLKDNIWICDAVKSPFILGIIRPRIYLSSGTEEDQLNYVLAHEQAHLKRRDHWWKPLGFLLLSVYWYHPLVWAAYILLCRDIEIACDEKVIKDMDMTEKKAYSNALVTCSTQRKIIMACPLAFGEVGVKERVQTVLNYRKPSFWLIAAAIIACVAMAACFLTNPKNDTFDIKIVIPAGSERATYYSEEEISPHRNKVTLSSGEGLGDTAVNLKPIECSEENAYDEYTYMTLGMPVTIAAEKGGWFQIGVLMSNPTDQDIIVYVRAKKVDVRISCPAETPAEILSEIFPDNAVLTDNTTASSDLSEEQESAATVTSLEDAVSAAILERDGSSYMGPYNFECCDFVLLETSYETPADGNDVQIVTCYGWALHEHFNITEQGIEDCGGSHIPTALTFEQRENGYVLKEYWLPREGSYYVDDIRNKFPAEIANDGIDSQKFILQQMQSCYKQAVEFSHLDTDAVIGNLLATICSGPETSSNPYDYINVHPIEYRELMHYGEYTLRYCFKRFQKGNETGLDGRIMAIACEKLLQTEGRLPEDAATALTGQLWYDTLLAHGPNLMDPYLESSEAESNTPHQIDGAPNL